MRRSFRALATLVGVLLVSELLLLAVGTVYPHPASWRRAQADRDRLLGIASGQAQDPDAPPPDAASIDVTAFNLGKDTPTVHPYVGYVRSRTETRGGHRVPAGSLGFETEDVLRKRAPDRLIVAITGGSFAKNLAFYAESRLAEALGRGRFAGRRVELVNLAMGGYKQPQQLMALAYVLSLGGELDVLVNVDGFNDVALYPFERERVGPYFFAFPRLWPMLTVRLSDPDRRLLGETEYLDFERARIAQRFSGFPWRYSTLANAWWVFQDDTLRRRKGKLEEYLGEQVYRSGPSDYVRLGPSREFADDAALAGELGGLWARASRLMDGICRASGIAYYHFLQPNQYVAGSKPMGEAERAVAWREDQPYRPGAVVGYPVLIEEGAQLASSGVRFHDLTQLFADHPEPLYLDDCCHLNDAGHALVLDEIVRVLLAD